MADSRLKAFLIRFIESEGRDFLSYSAVSVCSSLGSHAESIVGRASLEYEEGSPPCEKLSACYHRSAAKPSSSAILGIASRRPSMLDRLKKVLSSPDENFTERLLRLIKESGMGETECYKRAHIDRKLFSKIRSDLHYHPRKQTALAFAIALELDEEGAKALLASAGYALSSSDRFDLAISYFIRDGFYDITAINELLLALDLPLLGS